MLLSVTLSLGTVIGIALLRDEALALAPSKSASSVTTFASVVALVAVDDFLSAESHGFLHSHANAVSGS